MGITAMSDREMVEAIIVIRRLKEDSRRCATEPKWRRRIGMGCFKCSDKSKGLCVRILDAHLRCALAWRSWSDC